MTYVVTYIDVRQGSISEATTLLRNYRAASRGHEGNLETSIAQERSRPNRFVIVEVWKDESASSVHEGAMQVAEFRSSLRKIHNSPYDQRVHHDFAVASRSEISGESFWSVTHVDVPPPRREETEVLLRRLAEQSRMDEGHRRYDVFQQNAPRTNHFTIVAVWKNENGFVSNAMKPHTREFRDALGPMLGAPYDERLYRLLA
jgi:quinol monooxygenase YgiN